MLKLGLNTPTAFKVGASSVCRLYFGSAIVYDGCASSSSSSSSSFSSSSSSAVAAYADGLIATKYTGYFGDTPSFFDTAPVVSTQIASSVTLGYPYGDSGEDLFSWQWLGYFKPQVTATYTFALESDDGSLMWIGETALTGYSNVNALIDNGGIRGSQKRYGSVALTAGVYYPIRVQYGENLGGETMTLTFAANAVIGETSNGLGYFFHAVGASLSSSSSSSSLSSSSSSSSSSSNSLSVSAVGYAIAGSADYSGNYTTSGTLPPSSDSYPAWQHASNNYILVYTGATETGWALFPGTIVDGYTGPPIAWQACGYPGGGSGTCAQETVDGAYTLADGSGVLNVTATAGAGLSSSSSSSSSSSTSSSSSSSSSAAAGAAFAITAQPQNNFSTTYTSNANFSVTAVGVGTLSYQWQGYYYDYYTGNYGWNNISGATAATLSLSGSSASNYGIDPYSTGGMMQLRVVVTDDADSSTLTSQTVRWVDYSAIGAYADFYGNNGSYSSGSTTVGGVAYSNLSLQEDEPVNVNVYDMGYSYFDTSWYSSNAFTVKIQSSADATTWADVETYNYRGSGFWFGTTLAAQYGVLYYRVLVIGNWPLTATNGTQSATRTALQIVAGAYKITWPPLTSKIFATYLGADVMASQTETNIVDTYLGADVMATQNVTNIVDTYLGADVMATQNVTNIVDTYLGADVMATQNVTNIVDTYLGADVLCADTALTITPRSSSSSSSSSSAAAVANFTGFARATDNRGGSIGILGWPATWSNTSNSFTITNVPNQSPQFNFTLSGNTGAITRTNPSPAGNYWASDYYWSTVNHGGGSLEKDGTYIYYQPSSLNAGSYWILTPSNSDSGYPNRHTVTVAFANSVLTSAAPAPYVTPYVQFTPAAEINTNGLVTSFTVYANANSGQVLFTVPAGSARSVTIAFTAGGASWDLTTGGVNALRSVVNYNNAGWALDKFGTYSAPYPYGTTKTLTLNPGDYIVDLRQSRYGGGYTGTITIT